MSRPAQACLAGNELMWVKKGRFSTKTNYAAPRRHRTHERGKDGREFARKLNMVQAQLHVVSPDKQHTSYKDSGNVQARPTDMPDVRVQSCRYLMITTTTTATNTDNMQMQSAWHTWRR